MALVRCRTCVMPNTRPDTPFIDGECAACRNFKRRPEIDWAARRAQLVELLDRHHGRVLVPSSGGKDSTYQALTLIEMGADVTVVTARTCHLTPVGRANIDNLARHARTIEVVPNMTVRAKLNRLGLEMVGDISWPEHCAVFTAPFQVAMQTNHTLLMYGECPNREYGGPIGSEESMQLTARWRSEFGGFLGLRPDDFVGVEGITDRQMDDYRMPSVAGIEAHFLGQYIPWDSERNGEMARAAGMQVNYEVPGRGVVAPCEGNWLDEENLDNAQTGIHDWFAWLKYRYSRGTAQVSMSVRAGRVPREQALDFATFSEGRFPATYMGVTFEEVLDRIGMSLGRFNELCGRFTDRELHRAG